MQVQHNLKIRWVKLKHGKLLFGQTKSCDHLRLAIGRLIKPNIWD